MITPPAPPRIVKATHLCYNQTLVQERSEAGRMSARQGEGS